MNPNYCSVIVKINVHSIQEAFNFHSLEEANYCVNLEMSSKAFDNARIEVNKQMVMAFVKEFCGVKLAHTTIKHKLDDYDNYNDSLVNTHIALYQVLGMQNNKKFTHTTMWICWGYQKVGEDFILDFPTYLDKCINEGLIAPKQEKQVPF